MNYFDKKSSKLTKFDRIIRQLVCEIEVWKSNKTFFIFNPFDLLNSTIFEKKLSEVNLAKFTQKRPKMTGYDSYLVWLPGMAKKRLWYLRFQFGRNHATHKSGVGLVRLDLVHWSPVWSSLNFCQMIDLWNVGLGSRN